MKHYCLYYSHLLINIQKMCKFDLIQTQSFHLENFLHYIQALLLKFQVYSSLFLPYSYILIPLNICSEVTVSSSPCEETLSNNIFTVWNKICISIINE